MSRRLQRIAALLACFIVSTTFCRAQHVDFVYAPSPADNPLRGLVPYSGDRRDQFPHSMEFNYLPLNKLMVGANQFDWSAMEELLNDVSSRGHQTVVRVWIEYPGKNGIPAFLIDEGVKVTKWLNTNTDPFPRKNCWTPDYSDPRMRRALQRFIDAFGKKYDGDSRLGFITAGLLGTWGEWHTYPRTELFASKKVQSEVMQAYVKAFKTTPVLLRYPAGPESFAHAPNHRLRLGYHDDSFAWATLDTGKSEDSWFFMAAMKAAGATEKWKTSPIGGEIRPELWGEIFDAAPNHEKAQDFAKCVQQTHVTWLMDSGMFAKEQNRRRYDRAIEQVQKMGYEFHVSSADIKRSDGKTQVAVHVRNTGVAPFYYGWNLELGVPEKSKKTWRTDWKLTGLLPGETRVWETELDDVPSIGFVDTSCKSVVRRPATSLCQRRTKSERLVGSGAVAVSVDRRSSILFFVRLASFAFDKRPAKQEP